MCIEALRWAWELPLHSDLKLLLVHYSDMANHETGNCWPGFRLTQKRTGFRRERIGFLNRLLVEAGLLLVEEGRRRVDSNRYHVRVGAKLKAPITKLPAQRRGHWPVQRDTVEPKAVIHTRADQGGSHVRTRVVHTWGTKPSLTPINPNSTVLTDSGATLAKSPRHHPEGVGKGHHGMQAKEASGSRSESQVDQPSSQGQEPQSDQAEWRPTNKMIGRAHNVGVDWRLVADRLEEEAASEDLPWPPVDNAAWLGRWCATCEAEASGQNAPVSAYVEDIWEAEEEIDWPANAA